MCLCNAEARLKGPRGGDRDYYAGKCCGHEEVLDIERKMKDHVRPNDRVVS